MRRQYRKEMLNCNITYDYGDQQHAQLHTDLCRDIVLVLLLLLTTSLTIPHPLSTVSTADNDVEIDRERATPVSTASLSPIVLF